MYARSVFLLLFCVALCLAEETTESTTEKNLGIPSMSEPVLLLTVTACVTAPVLSILLLTLTYYKYCGNNWRDEVV